MKLTGMKLVGTKLFGMKRLALSLSLSLALSLLVACGSKPPPPATDPSDPEAPRSSGAGPKLQMSTELGSIDQRATQTTIDGLQPKLQGCYKKGLKKLDFMAGDLKFFLRVSQEGSVKYAFLEDTTLGDRDVEKCMLDVLNGASWPKPEGGEAEVRNGIGFDHAGDVREPTPWTGDKLAELLGKHEPDFKKCKEGVSGSFKVTAYVEPDGKDGKIVAVGMAPPSKEGEGKIECLVDAVKGMKKVPSPGSYPAKVQFNL
jgi:hypothetical protein